MRSQIFLIGLFAISCGSALPTTFPRNLSSTLASILSFKPKLTFDRDGKFKAVSFSDMHVGERWGNGSFASWGPVQDENTQRVHATVLDREKPKYVVFNGDLVAGENLLKQNATKNLDTVFAPTVARNLPFSTTQGNHDNAIYINHDMIIQYEQRHFSKLSYTRSDVGPRPYGGGNYYVPIYAKSSDFVPAVILWFFDSRSFVSGTGDGPGPVPPVADEYWVDDKSVPQYIKAQSIAMKLFWGKLPPSLVFEHIPAQKAQLLAPLPSAGDHDNEPDPAAQGFYKNVYTGKDLPFWNSIVQDLGAAQGNVLAVTSGHDHGESWCARSKDSSGVPICGGYTTPHSLVRNGRVFDLDLKQLAKQKPTVTTWNSYEDKKTGERVTLGPDYMSQYN